MSRQFSRRSVLIAGSAVGLSALAGCTGVRSRVEAVAGDLPVVGSVLGPDTFGGSLPAAVERAGSYDVIVPGSDAEAAVTYHYRSETGPLRRESDVGGIAEVVPQDAGVRMAVDLTPEDVYGAAGVQLGPIDIDDIESIRFEATGEIFLGVPLGIANNDGTIGAWESAGDGLQRQVGFDGDDRVLAGSLSADESPISRSAGRFQSPPDGGAGPLEDVSLADIQARFGNISVRLAAFVDAPSGESRQVVVKTLEATLRG